MRHCLIGQMPNTYTMTKKCAENLVNHRAFHLPAGIFRPPIGEYSKSGWLVCGIFIAVADPTSQTNCRIISTNTQGQALCKQKHTSNIFSISLHEHGSPGGSLAKKEYLKFCEKWPTELSSCDSSRCIYIYIEGRGSWGLPDKCMWKKF